MVLLDHRTVDSRHSIITDTFVTPPSNVHGSIPYIDRSTRQREGSDLPQRPLDLMLATSLPAAARGYLRLTE